MDAVEVPSLERPSVELRLWAGGAHGKRCHRRPPTNHRRFSSSVSDELIPEFSGERIVQVGICRYQMRNQS